MVCSAKGAPGFLYFITDVLVLLRAHISLYTFIIVQSIVLQSGHSPRLGPNHYSICLP